MSDTDARVVRARWLGRVPYGEALALQSDLVRRRREEAVSDQLLLLEHPHVITLGSTADATHVLATDEDRTRLGIERFEVGRGGDVTYHGPGQLVGYPILGLAPDRKDLHAYLRDLESVLIRVVERLGVTGPRRRQGLTGVWVPNGKLAAIGVRVSSGWITSHGFALNVDPDLEFFRTIVPCGITDERVTSIAREVGKSVSVTQVIPSVLDAFSQVFARPVHYDGPALG